MRGWMRRSLGPWVLVSILAMSGAAFADDLLLKLDNIKGESTRAKDEIDISSFSWGFSQADANGRPTAQRFVVHKFVDAASPLLVQHLLEGRTIENARFVVRRSGGASGAAATPSVQIDLKGVRVVDVQVTGSDSARPTENVSFTFTKLTYQYFSVDPRSGRASGPGVSANWDLNMKR